MKKIITILLIILTIALIGFGVFYFFGNGKKKISDFFGENSFGSFFDIDTNSQNDFSTNIPEEIEELQTTDTPYQAPVLRQISFEPISGYTFYSTTSTSTRNYFNDEGNLVVEEYKKPSNVIRFQERATGHIYDVYEFIISPQKISNQTIQKIYSTLFSTNINKFVYQMPSFNNEQVNSYFGEIIYSTSTEVSISKNDLSSSISDFKYNKKTNKLIYSMQISGVSNIYTSNIDRTNEKLITTLPFNQFLIDNINENEILITTKSSATSQGYSYTLNLNNGSLDKIIGNIQGLLVKISSDKKYFIFSRSEVSRTSINLYSTSDRVSRILPFDTIPSEKCIFSEKNTTIAYCFGSLSYKSATYPDDWYKGKIFNSESLYKIDATNGRSEPLYLFESDDLSIDAINIKLNDEENIIMFQNKKDLTLWALDISRLNLEI